MLDGGGPPTVKAHDQQLSFPYDGDLIAAVAIVVPRDRGGDESWSFDQENSQILLILSPKHSALVQGASGLRACWSLTTKRERHKTFLPNVDGYRDGNYHGGDGGHGYRLCRVCVTPCPTRPYDLSTLYKI